MIGSHYDLLRGLVDKVTRSMFAEMGVVLEPNSNLPDVFPSGVAAALGFTGERIRGAVAMVSTPEFIVAVWPKELRDRKPTDVDIKDWAAELVNQLMGRIKLELLRYNLTLSQSLPAVFLGDRLRCPPPATYVVVELSYSSAATRLSVHLDAEIEPGVTFEVSQDAPDLPKEGDVVLF